MDSMDDELELAYLAGFFDGEGCVNIQEYIYPPTANRSGTAWRLRIQIGNTCPDVFPLFVRRFGGSLRMQKRHGNRKQQWVWTAAANDASNALLLMLPYLVVKCRQAELGLDFQSDMGKSPQLTNNQIIGRRALKEALGILNGKGRITDDV